MKSSKKNRLLYLFIALDFFVVLLHIVFGSKNTFFHLDFEHNFPTYYQSFRLIGFGSLFLVVAAFKKLKLHLKSFILPLSIFMIILGLDELFQIHENTYKLFNLFEALHPNKIVNLSFNLGYRSSLWILYYIPFIFLFFLWSMYWIRHFHSTFKRNRWVFFLSSCCVGIILLMEILSSSGNYNESTYYWLITLEETTEMVLASTLIFSAKTLLGSSTHFRKTA